MLVLELIPVLTGTRTRTGTGTRTEALAVVVAVAWYDSVSDTHKLILVLR